MVSSGEGQVFDQAAFAPAPPTSFHIIYDTGWVQQTFLLPNIVEKLEFYDTGWVQQIFLLPNIVEKLEFHPKLTIVNL